MEERQAPRPPARSEPAAPLDRRGRDGATGTGDQLGGLGAGAGDRLGPDDDGAAATENQHSFADLEPATDSARNYHGPGDAGGQR